MVDEKSEPALFTAADKGGTGVCTDLWETRNSTTRRLDGALLNGRRTEGRRRRPVCPGVRNPHSDLVLGRRGCSSLPPSSDKQYVCKWACRFSNLLMITLSDTRARAT